VEGAGHSFVKRNNCQHGFLAANRTQQTSEGVYLDASFLGQVYDFHQRDRRECDLVTISGGKFRFDNSILLHDSFLDNRSFLHRGIGNGQERLK